MKLKTPPTTLDHHRGPLTAPVFLVEYGDFECPYCGAAYPVFERLIAEFKNDLCFVYRHFPLKNIHPHSELAARAAEAADQQKQFWPMHHLLFENQGALSSENILKMAEFLNLDLDRFHTDLRRDDLLQRLRADFNNGIRSGVNGTPTVYINDFRFNGPPLDKPLEEVIRSLIEPPQVQI